MKIQNALAILAGIANVLVTTQAVGMGGSITTIDPPHGIAFKDPVIMPNISKIPGIVEVNLEAKVAPINVNGVTASLMTYNGTYPAPTIKVKKGDILKIHFKNSLPNSGVNMTGEARDLTNLHTHGLHVSPNGNSDNVMLNFMSGDAFDYEYDLSMHPGGNLNWYHPHISSTFPEQIWGGMAGALEVADETTALESYETHTMVLKDITLNGSVPTSYAMSDFMHGKEGDIIMVNGQVNPVLNMRPGQIQRWKIVNASNGRFYKLSLVKHNLQVIGTDGGLLDKPYVQGSIVLAPGERIDIMVKASTTKGYYKLLSKPYATDDMSMAPSASNSQKITLLTINVAGKTVANSIPATINSQAIRLKVPKGTPTRKITLTMELMSGMPGMSDMAYINNIAYSSTTAYTAYSKLNTYEIWEIINDSGMDHPFHQHVNPAQVISITGGDAAYKNFYTTSPAWKDTVIVPKNGRVKLLVPIKDFTGVTMFHCHIPEHEAIGMAGLWDIK